MSARVFETVRVAAASKAYDVAVGRGLLDEVGVRVRAAVPGCDDAVLLVTDTNAGALYAERVGFSLTEAGFTVEHATVQAGEGSKNLDAYRMLLEVAAVHGLTRASTVVALGGGVVGDLAGFAAATYMRGCHLVQVATSLLAMVDSSVGGKTAVDLPQGKNLAGAFHQPDLVLCDLDCLGTLPPTYLADGMGEVAKYAVMADPELFGWLERPLAGQEERVVARCIALKRDVVEADEREAGVRKLLNLGHTVGHAIELLSGYAVPHGHAVAAGTAIMSRACAARGWCPAEDAGRIEALLRAHGLPTCSERDPSELAEAARNDKKRTGDAIDVVAVRGIGSCEVRRMGLGEFAELVDLGCAGAREGVAAEGFRVKEVRGERGGGLIGGLGAAGWRDPREPLGKEPVRATVRPGALAGEVEAIASKSAAHRMLICAALADGPTRIRCSTTSQDIEATYACLAALGAKVERSGAWLTVEPIVRDAPHGRTPWLPCGESGSTLRFMLPVVCALGCGGQFLMEGRLPERPLEPLRSRLAEHGCTIGPAGMVPLPVWGRMAGGTFDLPGNVSSQFVTGLLLALPLAGGGGCVRLHGAVESRPYIDLTVGVMRAFGVEVAESCEADAADGGGDGLTVFTVAPDARYASPGEAAVEGDWSNAAFWLCAGALSDEPVRVCGLDLASSQGDLAVLDVLGAMGAHVRCHPGEGWAEVCGCDPETGERCRLRGVEVDAHDVPDLVPVLCVVAACAEGDTRVVNAARLRIKESDRLATTAELVRSLGARVDELPDGLVVHGLGRVPGSGVPARAVLRACTVRSHGDHRIAMAAAVGATAADGPVEVCGANAVAKSYPGFFADFLGLGGEASVERETVTGGAFPPPGRTGCTPGACPEGRDARERRERGMV